jgi:type IV secretory pathway TrbD component
MTGPREVPLFRALNRAQLLFGADREAVIVIGVLAGILTFIIQTWIAFITGLVLWFGGIVLLRAAARYDPMLRRVMMRSVKYKSVYLGSASGLARLNKDEVQETRGWY